MRHMWAPYTTVWASLTPNVDMMEAVVVLALMEGDGDSDGRATSSASIVFVGVAQVRVLTFVRRLMTQPKIAGMRRSRRKPRRGPR